MKKLIFFIALSVVLFSCATKDNTSTNIQKDTTTAIIQTTTLKKDARKMGPEKSEEQRKIEEALKNAQNAGANSLLGSWVGAFGQTKINIFIEKKRPHE